jgi:hypothetical protein
MSNETKLIVCWLLVSAFWLIVTFIMNKRRGPELGEILYPIFGSGILLLLFYLIHKLL